MKKITPPDFNDFKTLRFICKNDKLSSYPDLWGIRHDMTRQYVKYIRAKGDVFGLGPKLCIAKNLKDSLISHYSSEVKGLDVISDIRNKLSPTVCPMCGGKYPTTVDHFIPKDKYPEYSFFTKNLVPACSCNAKRGGNDYMGGIVGQRVLHPYFDKELSEIRLIRAEVEPPFESPRISLVVCCTDENLKITTKYHLDKVVSKTNVLNVLDEEWRNLVRLYDDHFDLEPGIDVTVQLILEKLRKMLRKEDRLSGTPNNWSSMLLAGILANPDVVDYLTAKIRRFEAQIESPADY